MSGWNDPHADPVHEWSGHRDPAESWDGGPLLVHDDRVLWHLRPGTFIREVESGRRFMVALSPGHLHVAGSAGYCAVSDLELPVEVVTEEAGAR